MAQDTHKTRHPSVCDKDLLMLRSLHRFTDSAILEKNGETMLKGTTLHQSKILPPAIENVTKASRFRQYPCNKSPHDKAKLLHVLE